MYNFISFLGIFVLLGVAWLFSSDRRVINWRAIAFGVSLQMVFALFVFVVPAGTKLFLFINDAVVRVLDSATAGTRFLFGRLALPPGAINEVGEESLGFFLAFQALPTIVFFSSLMALLYQVGLMPRLIRAFARTFSKLLRISGAEALCVSSEIFVGIESAMTVRPHLGRMTNSELCTILTAGMATIASSVMALYVFILQKDFPTIAGHLVSASMLSAPAAIVVSKLIMPETGKPETLGVDVMPYYEKESSAMEAIMGGANAGVKMVVGIVAMLLAFLGIVALIDMLLSIVGKMTGAEALFSLKGILGYVFYPFVLIIGVPPSDAMEIARLIGERVVVTEVKAYQDLAELISSGALKEPRSALLAAYALCGFTHVASLAIFVGGYSALIPERTKDLSSVGLRALLAATLATLMVASVAGTFYSGGSLLMKGM